jgi:predicted site-specific integrase-resolvase
VPARVSFFESKNALHKRVTVRESQNDYRERPNITHAGSVLRLLTIAYFDRAGVLPLRPDNAFDFQSGRLP